jgi:hypothetical protein
MAAMRRNKAHGVLNHSSSSSSSSSSRSGGGGDIIIIIIIIIFSSSSSVRVKLNGGLPWQKLNLTRRRVFLPANWT